MLEQVFEEIEAYPLVERKLEALEQYLYAVHDHSYLPRKKAHEIGLSYMRDYLWFNERYHE